MATERPILILQYAMDEKGKGKDKRKSRYVVELRLARKTRRQAFCWYIHDDILYKLLNTRMRFSHHTHAPTFRRCPTTNIEFFYDTIQHFCVKNRNIEDSFFIWSNIWPRLKGPYWIPFIKWSSIPPLLHDENWIFLLHGQHLTVNFVTTKAWSCCFVVQNFAVLLNGQNWKSANFSQRIITCQVSFFKQALSIDFACVLIKFTCALSTISNITFFAGTNQRTIRDTTSRLWVAIVGKTCAFINILKMKKGSYLLDVSMKIKAVGKWQWPALH